MLKVKGEITVFLSLIFVVLVSFIGNLVQSVDMQVAKNQRRAVVDKAVYSAFGEYQKELLEEYEIFAIEGTYETGSYSEDGLLQRLRFYGAESVESDITGIQYLTDNHGTPFFEQVVTYMRDYSGISLASDLVGHSQKWTEQEIKGNQSEEDAKKADVDLEDALKENEEKLPEEDNPLPAVSSARKTPLLQLIMPKDKTVSSKAISLDGTVSHRNLQTGRGTFQVADDQDSAGANLLFGEYMLRRFSNAAKPKDGKALEYETEYLIAGKESDAKNLESVARRILLLRMGINFLYLQTDMEKQAEAETMAAALATAMAVPVATELVKQALLAAWSYGESIMDLRALLKGEKTALAKSQETWQLQLTSLARLMTGEEISDGANVSDGISYEDYLRILLFLEKKDTCTMRALDLMEESLQKEKGLTFFQADHCITGLQLQNKTTLERGITYEFPLYFTYQ